MQKELHHPGSSAKNENYDACLHIYAFVYVTYTASCHTMSTMVLQQKLK